MSFYLWLDFAVLAGPLALSFDLRVAYIRVWPSVFAAIVCVGVPFIAWDALAAANGIWTFNAAFSGDSLLFGLPFGELMFFAVVPFACLFIYEVVASYLPAHSFRFPRLAGFSLAALSAAAALAAYPRAYTEVVFGALALFFLLATTITPRFLGDRSVWVTLALCFLPFAAVNGLLTALPVVRYNPADILGVRIYTIPLEDFFYSFSMIGFLLLIHTALRRRLRLAEPKR